MWLDIFENFVASVEQNPVQCSAALQPPQQHQMYSLFQSLRQITDHILTL